MHRPFTPVPRWLDISMETTDRHAYTKAPVQAGSSFLTKLEQALEFQLQCFESLYRLGLSDRQTAEVTALTILLHKRYGHITMVPITEEGVEKWKKEHSGEVGPRWFREGRQFFWAFGTLDEFFGAWMAIHLPRESSRSGVGARFWGGFEDWPFIFLNGDRKELDALIEKLRILFAQHCLQLPITGWWDARSVVACKSFQFRYPKVMVPWRNGTLDGFTYKALARRWRVLRGLNP